MNEAPCPAVPRDPAVSPDPARADAGDVLTFGETMAALRGSGPLKLGGSLTVSVAGAESNTAIGLARLGHAVRWAGAVGADEAGELVLRTLRAEGVDVSGARRDPDGPTGLILFEPRLPEVTRVHYYRTGSAGSRIDPGLVEAAFAARAPRVLHLTGITPALGPAPLAAVRRALELAHSHATLVCLDVNFRARLWTADAARAVLSALVPDTDVLIASDDELPLCLPPGTRLPHDSADPAGRTAAARLLTAQGPGKGPREVVVKLGADGAVRHTADDVLHRAARPVHAVDPVGAGDAFSAGYLSALLDGAAPGACLERAVTTGAFAVASHGDWEGAPTRAELGLLGSAPGTVVR